MNGSELAGSSTASSPKSKEDPKAGNGHEETESNPFAEYISSRGKPLGDSFPRAVPGQVEEELQEQEFLDRCFQEMLEEEEQEWFIPARDLPQGMAQLQQQLHGLGLGDGHGTDDILVSPGMGTCP
ncbi:hypothetical protein EK904_003143, partial [Melospiza melodia maxima]